MAELPNVEARMLHVGLPPAMAGAIAAEVPDVKTAFHTYFGLALVAACGVLAAAAIQIPALFLLSSALGSGEAGNCPAGSRNVQIAMYLQFQAAIASVLLLQWFWLTRAGLTTRTRFIAARLLWIYSAGFGAGAMRPLLGKRPEIQTPNDLFLMGIRPRLRYGVWVWAVLQAAAIGVLWFLPPVCR